MCRNRLLFRVKKAVSAKNKFAQTAFCSKRKRLFRQDIKFAQTAANQNYKKLED